MNFDQERLGLEFRYAGASPEAGSRYRALNPESLALGPEKTEAGTGPYWMSITDELHAHANANEIP